MTEFNALLDNFESDLDRAIVQANAARVQAQVDAIQAAGVVHVVTEVTTTREVALKAPAKIDRDREVTLVRIKTTEFNDGSEPYLEVSGWAYALTAKGVRDKRATGYWSTLSDEVAAAWGMI
jgi:hypothetical protein